MRLTELLNNQKHTFSFEFFPPKSEEAVDTLMGRAGELAALKPAFVSVTYGAGGSTRQRTLDVIVRLQKEVGLDAAAHLTCVGHSRDELIGILNTLRSSKEQGQSNFNNPGTVLVGAGADADLTPTFRLSGNVNHLWFEDTSTLEALRMQGSIPKPIGWDVSAAAIWRPLASQNIVGRLSAAALLPGKGFDSLFDEQDGDADAFYSVLANIILAF